MAVRDWLSRPTGGEARPARVQLSNDAPPALRLALAEGALDEALATPRVLDIRLGGQTHAPLVRNARTVQINADEAPWPALANEREDFTTVVLADVLHHVSDPVLLLRRAFSRLAVDGRLIVAVRRGARSRRSHSGYDLSRLILDMKSACESQAWRTRFAREFDLPAADASARSKAPSDLVVIVERSGGTALREPAPLVEIERLPDYATLDHEALVGLNVSALRAGGLTLDDIKRICVFKLDHIGDFAMTVPAFVELRATFPESHITLACGPWNEAFARGLGLFDDIVVSSYYGQDEKFGGHSRGIKIKAAQRLGAALDGAKFDLAIDFRTPPDGREVLTVADARLRAGVGTPSEFPYLDIALPTFEAFHQGARRIEDEGRVVWEATAFTYLGKHRPFGAAFVCEPATTDYFISGPYRGLPTGRYGGEISLARASGGAARKPLRVSFDIAVSSGEVLFQRDYEIREGSAPLAFEFVAYLDLRDGEFRFRLLDPPDAPVALIFAGVTMSFAGREPDRRRIPLGSIHIAEHATLLLALIRSRLAAPVDPDQIAARLARGAVGAEGDFIAIAPFSNSLLRDWPEDDYAQLGRRLLDRASADLLLVGSAGQKAALERLAARIEPGARRVRVLAGAGWSELIATLARARLVVTNNSGLAHVAALIGVRSLSLYSASHQAIEWGPVGERAVALQAALNCGPCGLDSIEECANGLRCMRMITPESVVAAIEAHWPQALL
jgi:ADP-heptose:LPS heptosyltransferase